ncbi:PREDICTED: zinc finger and SCAN domain-containing protein 12-like [Rhagoletis zephyria]|uniref:zinc finger and SCAN domain-containing protein 12-like n=1 Tax=Rhagoletis zephyria TaxID=28612 RepID=UPI0008116692|nr:PREDICTED: zinc finger and SCAN domain-containing protein 12-like [Rhagoletis zephyria]
MVQAEEVVNSCRVCRSPNQDADYECLYVVQVVEEDGVMHSHTWQLTATGKLYEEMLGFQIDASTMELYPQYLCNSCDLQMRLFRKLTMKARRTLEELAKMYPDAGNKDANMTQNCEEMSHLAIEANNDTIILGEEFLENGLPSMTSDENAVIQSILKDTNVAEHMPNGTEYDNGQAYAPITLEPETFSNEVANAELVLMKEKSNEVPNELQVVALDGNEGLYYTATPELDTQPPQHTDIKSSSDTKEIEFVSLFDDNSSQGQHGLKQEAVEFFDVHYLEDTNSGLPINALERPKPEGGGIRRAHECQACGLEFLRRTDFLQHRKTVHSNKFPCPFCSKLLHTNDALRVHLRLHGGEPAYKCDLCQRTFNQKVHYRYHMDRHNNVRNFKCTVCEKAFLSKHDLTVHMRTHTGERPYECEICGKDFLILQHLKMHRYSHTSKSFECPECKQKFISPSTLRIHQHTIHTSERRFQCEFCVKRFRRKHHLITHYKVHQKPEYNTSGLEDLVEEGEYSETDGYQIASEQIHDVQQLTIEDDGDFLEIHEDEHIDGILIVDDEDGDTQAIYGTDYVIGVAEESADMVF